MIESECPANNLLYLSISYINPLVCALRILLLMPTMLIAGFSFYVFVFGGFFLFAWTTLVWWVWKVFHSVYFAFLDPWFTLVGLKNVKKNLAKVSSFAIRPDTSHKASTFIASAPSAYVHGSAISASATSYVTKKATVNTELQDVVSFSM